VEVGLSCLVLNWVIAPFEMQKEPVRLVRPSVRPSVRPFARSPVRLFVRTHHTRKREFGNQQIRALLVLPDLSQGDRTGSESMRLFGLDAASGDCC
jgi:hypothetical protein